MTVDRGTLVAGLGSPWGDDCLGWEVAARVAAARPSAVVAALRSPAELLDRLSGVVTLHVVDACRGAGPPGTVYRGVWPTADLAQLQMSGSHDLSLPTALAIADQLELLPATTIIWGIEMEMTTGREFWGEFRRGVSVGRFAQGRCTPGGFTLALTPDPLTPALSPEDGGEGAGGGEVAGGGEGAHVRLCQAIDALTARLLAELDVAVCRQR